MHKRCDKKKYFKIFIVIFIIPLALWFITCKDKVVDDEKTDSDITNNNNNQKVDISMITPYINQSDMASINEAFSIDTSAPWGFEHRGIDFFPNGDLKPFQAVSDGLIDEVSLWQLESTLNWQVSIRLIYNTIYAVNYAFEPMSNSKEDGEIQLAHILVAKEQNVSQGDTLGYLFTPQNGAHVDFSLFKDWEPVCPESYFIQPARDSIINLIRVVWPGGNICY